MKTQALFSQPGSSSLQRPRYSEGLLLEDEDLTAAVVYTRETMRLLMSSLFGCGVVCGLDVTATLGCKGRKLTVNVGRGLALDASGNPVHVPESIQLAYDFECRDLPGKIWVVACYAEKACRPKDVSCSQDEDSRREATRYREGYEITLYDTFPGCACGCPKPEAPPAKDPRGGCCQDDVPPKQAPAPKKVASVAPPAAEPSAPTPVPAPPSPAQPPGTGETPKGDRWATILATAEAECACYVDHLKGVCACDCGCSCVLLAVITLSDEVKTKDDAPIVQNVDSSVRREVRPMLNGFYKCLATAKVRPKPADPATPAQPADPKQPTEPVPAEPPIN